MIQSFLWKIPVDLIIDTEVDYLVRFDSMYVGKLSKKSEDSIVRIEATKKWRSKAIKTIIEVELNKILLITNLNRH